MKAWAVIEPSGKINTTGIQQTKRDTIFSFLTYQNETWYCWERLKKQGYTCKKITITKD